MCSKTIGAGERNLRLHRQVSRTDRGCCGGVLVSFFLFHQNFEVVVSDRALNLQPATARRPNRADIIHRTGPFGTAPSTLLAHVLIECPSFHICVQAVIACVDVFSGCERPTLYTVVLLLLLCSD